LRFFLFQLRFFSLELFNDFLLTHGSSLLVQVKGAVLYSYGESGSDSGRSSSGTDWGGSARRSLENHGLGFSRQQTGEQEQTSGNNSPYIAFDTSEEASSSSSSGDRSEEASGDEDRSRQPYAASHRPTHQPPSSLEEHFTNWMWEHEITPQQAARRMRRWERDHTRSDDEQE